MVKVPTERQDELYRATQADATRQRLEEESKKVAYELTQERKRRPDPNNRGGR